MSFSYSNQNNRGLNDQSTSSNDLTAGNFTTNQLIASNLTFNFVLSNTVVNSFTAGYQYWNNLIDSTNKVPNVTFPNTINFGTNVNVPQQSYQVKWQFRDDDPAPYGQPGLAMGQRLQSDRRQRVVQRPHVPVFEGHQQPICRPAVTGR
jgi:hypothetical protein